VAGLYCCSCAVCQLSGGRPVLLQLCSVSAVRWPPVPGVAYIYLCLSGNNVSLATFSAFTNKY